MTSAETHSSPKIIYDLGSNNGDDIPYYLLKAEKVIAVEANIKLCELIAARFQSEVSQNRLIIENCAITESRDGEIDFYLHNQYHVLSSLLAPSTGKERYFTKTTVKAISVASLIKKHGSPYYAKIDIEKYDENILSAFAVNQIVPPYISAESHTIGVFALLSEKLPYSSFKLVEGKSVSRTYQNTLLYSPILEKHCVYSFPHHSAGPFGNDIHGEWMTKEALLKLLALHGLGWKDIHASRLDKPTLSF